MGIPTTCKVSSCSDLTDIGKAPSPQRVVLKAQVKEQAQESRREGRRGAGEWEGGKEDG